MRKRRIATSALLLIALLPLLTADVIEGQSVGVDGPGEAAPWSVEGSPTPMRRPDTPKRATDDFWERMEQQRRGPPGLRCRILEVEELGRINVQEDSGDVYWIQLPPEVKIRTHHRGSFDGRRKLTIDDLEAGQRLVVTLKDNTDEIVKVMVTPAPETAPATRPPAQVG